MNLTEAELVELIRRAERDIHKKMPSTRREKKDARKDFKALRMKLRQDEKRRTGMTRSQIDREKTLQSSGVDNSVERVD